MRWLRFFMGTPVRASVSLLVLVAWIVVERFAPGTTATGLIAVGTSVLSAIVTLGERFLAPLFWQFILPLAIVWIGFRTMWRGVFGGGKRKKR